MSIISGKEITVYRVRKTSDGIKTQKGAFLILENAIKLAKLTRCNVYDNSKKCIWKYEG